MDLRELLGSGSDKKQTTSRRCVVRMMAAGPAALLLSRSAEGSQEQPSAAPGGVSAKPSEAEGPRESLWIAGTPQVDSYAAFRAVFDLPAASEVTLRYLGASWFVVWVDGEFVGEGPSRFLNEWPEYHERRLRLPAGKHAIAAQVHFEGVSTRLLEGVAPFWSCELWSGGEKVQLRWRAKSLEGYASQVRRINAQLGWMEWLDARQVPAEWQTVAFDESGWAEPARATPGLGTLRPLSTADVRSLTHQLHVMAEGRLVERFGYERDNPPARFFLRNLAPVDTPAQGVWRRYDLGRVRLGRPRIALDLPAGSVVEMACCESLVEGRVSPWITLSASDSCNMDHHVARGGIQEFFPLTPKGGRFLEVHVLAPSGAARFIREEYVERTYHDAPEGSFHSDDPLLNRIWMTGIESYRACSEDAVIDNPTRERGQWLGDVASVGMEIAAAGFRDLRLFRRGLVQFALCARKDGLVAGLCPGGRSYLSTYAAQFVTACLRYWQLTGDKSVLRDLFTAAIRNIGAFESVLTPEGVPDAVGWGFVDWGYVRNPGPVDIGVNLHFAEAVRSMVRWCEGMGDTGQQEKYSALAKRMDGILERWFEGIFATSPDPWKSIGFHRAALGLKLGFLRGQREQEALAFMKEHILKSFPNAPEAPRLSDPGVENPQIFTPYFAHFALPVLIERGEMPFVLDLYRRDWGWGMQDGRTTWLEVFDTRWSHCHQWSGCPTWQLTRYMLGLNPRFDWGDGHYEVVLKPGTVKRVEGAIPVPGQGGVVRVRWSREKDGLHYRLETAASITLHLSAELAGKGQPVIPVSGVFERVFPVVQA